MMIQPHSQVFNLKLYRDDPDAAAKFIDITHAYEVTKMKLLLLFVL